MLYVEGLVVNYYNEDFTTDNYKKIIKKAKEKYTFIPFSDAYGGPLVENKVLWRHDVDFSINWSCILSEIEDNAGVKASYFIHLHSRFYSILETETLRKLYRILQNGAEIGLHFDFEFYYRIYGENISELDLEEAAYDESRMLKKLLCIDDSVRIPISFHNPELCNVMDIQHDCYGGMINAYSSRLKENFHYCSDSNGYWRYERLEDILLKKEYENLQILTHPGWWQNKVMSPSERVQKILKDRSEEVYNNYCELLLKGNRLNVE